MFAWLVTSCQQVWIKLLTTCNSCWCYQTCYRYLLLIMSSSLLQVVNNLFQTCYNKSGTSSANTTCWQLENRLVTTCLQTCNLQLVCFYMCRTANDIDFLMDSLPRDKCCIELQIASLGKLTLVHTKNLTTCSKSANKPSTSCVHTACYKLSTSLEQAVNNLWQPCWYCQTCYKVVPTRLLQSWYNDIATTLCRQPCNILVISWRCQTC